MASIEDLRSGLADNLATVLGLRSTATVPDNPNPPIAIVSVQSVQYDSTFHAGVTRYNFAVTVVVGRVDARTAQNKLDGYLSSTGTNSVKLAIESDKTLGGAAFDVRCDEVRNIGELSFGDVNYLSAEFNVLCLAN